jgi:hypothetical protein
VRAVTDLLRQRVESNTPGLLAIDMSPTGDIVRLKSDQFEEYLLQQLESGDAVALALWNSDVAGWNNVIRHQLGRVGVSPEATDRVVTTKSGSSLGLLNGTDLVVRGLCGPLDRVDVNVRDGSGVIPMSAELQPTVLSISTPSGETIEFEAPIIVDILQAPDREVLRHVRRALWVDFVMRMESVGIKRNSEEFLARLEEDERVNALHLSYSYARTLFRAQGGEWTSVIVDGLSLGRKRQCDPRESYSAITRVKTALYLHNWPNAAREFSEEELVAKPRSILQMALRQSVSSRRIAEKNRNKEGVAAVSMQLSARGNGEDVVVDVFGTSRGTVNYSIRKQASSAAVQEKIRQELAFWRASENVNTFGEVPQILVARLRDITQRLEALGFDVVAGSTGNYEITICIFANPRWGTVRWSHNARGQITTQKNTDGMSDLVARIVEEVGRQAPPQSLSH